MGYLDNSSITVDAILTKHGRFKLAQGQGLGITKFALSDDGINYNLWNTDHVSGSDSYGEAIKNLPQMEAVPDDVNNMRYKLMTMDRNTVYMPMIRTNVINDTITLSQQGADNTVIFAPGTANHPKETYTFTISTLSGLVGISGKSLGIPGPPLPHKADMHQPISISGNQLKLQARATIDRINTGITVTGNTSGAQGFIEVITIRNILRSTKP